MENAPNVIMASILSLDRVQNVLQAVLNVLQGHLQVALNADQNTILNLEDVWHVLQIVCHVQLQLALSAILDTF
jgi:hypothetical protein